MSKHTPGPWVVDALVDGYDIHAPVARCHIATASDPEMVWGAIGREADARLIAAAPEMLAALELIESAKDRGFGIDYARGCARAAIAKAKREE